MEEAVMEEAMMNEKAVEDVVWWLLALILKLFTQHRGRIHSTPRHRTSYARLCHRGPTPPLRST